MGKIVWDEKKIEEFQQDGCGLGEGANYKPWIRVEQVASEGRARRAHSLKTGRMHHFLSDGEAKLFYGAEWDDSVLDIREQFPLPREETQRVAEQLRIAHPHYVDTKVPMVMTADFLLTIQSASGKELVAFNVKVDSAAEDEITMAKLEIQRAFFAENGIKHHLIFGSRMPKQVMANIEAIRTSLVKPDEPERFVGCFPELELAMTQQVDRWQGSEMPLNTYCSEFDGMHGLPRATALRIAKILMAKKVIKVPLASKNLTKEPLSKFPHDTAAIKSRNRA